MKANSGLKVIHFDSSDPQKGISVGSVASKEEKQLHIRCFGKLSFSFNGAPILLPTRKSEEILAFLVTSKRRAAMRDEIIEALWPGLDSERGTNNFHVNLFNIRKTFRPVGLDDLLLQSKGCYYLRSEDVYCDIWEYDEIMIQLKRRGYRDFGLLERASQLYSGECFGLDGYEWSIDASYRYELSNEKVQYCIYEICMSEGHYTMAEMAMRRLIMANPYSPDPYEKCIYACLNRKDRTSALNYLRSLERIYSEDLNEAMPPNLLEIKNLVK